MGASDSEEGLQTVAREELEEMIGIGNRPLRTWVSMWEKGLHRYTLAHLDRVAEAEANLGPGLFLGADRIIGGADGILGLDSLQDQRVLLDFVREEIAIADADELGGNRGYEIVVKARAKLGQLIITEAHLDGVRVAVVVDSGAQGSIGNLALQQRFRRSRHMGETEVTDINGVAMSGAVKLADDLQIGRARLQNIPIMFADSPTFHALGLADQPALMLGMQELKLFRRVAIDFKTRRVLFDLPPQATFAGRGSISIFDR